MTAAVVLVVDVAVLDLRWAQIWFRQGDAITGGLGRNPVTPNWFAYSRPRSVSPAETGMSQGGGNPFQLMSRKCMKPPTDEMGIVLGGFWYWPLTP